MNANQPTLRTLKTSVASLLISAIFVVPFVVLQLVNRRTFEENFPFMLFTFMSLNSLLVVLLLTPALRRFRAARSLRALKLTHWAGLLLGVFLGSVYAGVVIDQLPCFLGVPNCD